MHDEWIFLVALCRFVRIWHYKLLTGFHCPWLADKKPKSIQSCYIPELSIIYGGGLENYDEEYFDECKYIVYKFVPIHISLSASTYLFSHFQIISPQEYPLPLAQAPAAMA